MASSSNTHAAYKGHNYRLLRMGETKFGRRAHLQFLDGSKDFWCDATLVTPGTVNTLSVGSYPTSNGSNGYRLGRQCFCAECGEPYRRDNRCRETGGNCIPEWE